MKYEGTMFGIPTYSDPNCPKDIIYIVNDNFTLQYPTRKDGNPDMRFSINRLNKYFRDMYFGK